MSHVAPHPPRSRFLTELIRQDLDLSVSVGLEISGDRLIVTGAPETLRDDPDYRARIQDAANERARGGSLSVEIIAYDPERPRRAQTPAHEVRKEIRASHLGQPLKRFLAALAEFADRSGRSIYPRVEQLQERAGISKKLTYRRLQELRQLGVLRQYDRTSSGLKVYQIDFYQLAMIAPQAPASRAPRQAPSSEPARYMLAYCIGALAHARAQLEAAERKRGR